MLLYVILCTLYLAFAIYDTFEQVRFSVVIVFGVLVVLISLCIEILLCSFLSRICFIISSLCLSNSFLCLSRYRFPLSVLFSLSILLFCKCLCMYVSIYNAIDSSYVFGFL